LSVIVFLSGILTPPTQRIAWVSQIFNIYSIIFGPI
jgi:hypothetical protein